MTSNGHVTIVGNPGAGKSRLTFQLINDVCKGSDEEEQSTLKVRSTGRDPLLSLMLDSSEAYSNEIDAPDKVLNAMKQHDNLAIAVDDIFGKDSLSDHIARLWTRVAPLIRSKCSSTSKARGHCLIINTRKDIFEKSKKLLKGKLLFSKENVVDLEECILSDKEKADILTQFIPGLGKDGISSVLKATPGMIGFPQCCYIMAETMEETVEPLEQMFENPVIPLKEELRRLQTDVPLKYSVLCLVLLNEGCSTSHMTINNSICERLLQMCASKDVSGITNEQIREAANACCPFYLTTKDSLFSFVHNTIKESVAECLWEEQPTFFIETCPIDLLRRLSRDDASPLYVENNLVSEVRNRMLKEIRSGSNQSFNIIAESEALNDEKFFGDVFSNCDILSIRNTENEMFLCFLIRQNSRDFVNKIIMSNFDKLDMKEVLAAACEGNKEKLVNTLLSREVQIDADVAFSAIKGGNSNIISKVLKKLGKLTNVTGSSKQIEDSNTNIFQEACLSGELDVLIHCICCSDVGATTLVNKYELLYYAIQSQSFDVMKFCVENSADLDRRFGEFQESALHTACTEGSMEITKYLIEKFPYLMDTTDSEGYTPLLNSVSRGRIDIFKLLIKHGADSNAKEKHGRTILHLAYLSGKKKLAFYILKHFRDLLYTRDNDEMEVIHYAALGGSIELLEHLVSIGLNVYSLDNGKVNILHRACREPNNEEMVTYLADKYPELLSQLDTEGNSVLHWAVRGGSIEVIDYLISEGLNVNQCKQYRREHFPYVVLVYI